MGENMDKIEKFLDKEIRPYLKSHGGDIEIINYSIEKQELNLRLKGQCCVCPHSIETNENFIKKSIVEKFSEIKNIYIYIVYTVLYKYKIFIFLQGRETLWLVKS